MSRDWSKVEKSSGFDLADPGVYHMEVVDCESRMGANGEYYSVKFRDLDHPKMYVWDIISFAPKALGMAKAKFEMLGVDLDSNPDVLPADLIGRRVALALKHETYEGTTRLKVDISHRGFECGYQGTSHAVTSKQGKAEQKSAQQELIDLDNDIPL